jgi:hypothetical protein
MESMKFCTLGVVTALLLSWGASAQVISTGPKVDVEYDRGKDFSDYKSYAWMESQKPADNLANHVRFTRAIQREMEDAGFRVDTVKPDVRIQYKVRTGSKIQAAGNQRQSTFDQTNLQTDFVFASGSRQQYGTLVLEMFDTATNILLWRATTTEPLSTPDKAEKLINDVVRRAFTRYPTREKN